jgi:riboflavin kinase/FMN adenylyltransferase
MKVKPLPEVEPSSRPRSVAIGTFDGVHLGHREVIRGASTALTFDPHPLSVIHPEATPKLIAPFSVKRDLIAGLGVEELVVVPFDRRFSEQSAEQFVQDVLVRRLGAARVSGRAPGAPPTSCAPATSSRRVWFRSSRWPARRSHRATSAA